MAGRFDAAETLTEQSESHAADGTRGRSTVQVSPGHPGTPAGSAPPHHLGLGEAAELLELSTIQQPMQRLGELGVSKLNEIMKKPQHLPELIRLNTTLIVRRTTGVCV